MTRATWLDQQYHNNKVHFLQDFQKKARAYNRLCLCRHYFELELTSFGMQNNETALCCLFETISLLGLL